VARGRGGVGPEVRDAPEVRALLGITHANRRVLPLRGRAKVRAAPERQLA